MNQTELRQTFNTISRNFESANETAQVNIYSFTQTYIDPCLTGFKSCLYDYTAPCFPNREDQVRRRHGRPRGRADFGFDFYDDWDEDESQGATGMGWGNDELDSLLAGRGVQPVRQRAMSYGARRRMSDPDTDPNVIPKSSYLGFLDRLPFRVGARGLRYKPSAAGLQENPGGLRIRDVEATEPLMEETEEDSDGEQIRGQGHKRQRSGTGASRSTATSRSARSDLIMSDEEDDAIPLDDEFAVILSRRTTNSEDHSSGKSRRTSVNTRPRISRVSTRTVSSRSAHSNKSRRPSSKKEVESSNAETGAQVHNEPPSMTDLKREEEQLREQEEKEIAQKREAAAKLARATGLNTQEAYMVSNTTQSGTTTPSREWIGQGIRSPPFASPSPGRDSDNDMEPFPTMSSPINESRSSIEPS